MSHLLPLYIGTGIFGTLFIFMPCFVRQGPNQGIIRCSMLLAVFSMWVFWATVYISQMNPLVGPRHKNGTLIFWRYKVTTEYLEPRPTCRFKMRTKLRLYGASNWLATLNLFPATVKSDGVIPPQKAEDAKPADAAKPADDPTGGGLRKSTLDHCQAQPDNVFECCNIPWVPRQARSKCLKEPVNVFKLKCAEVRCIFQEAGWFVHAGEVNLEQLNAYYDNLVETDQDWSEVVRLIKTQCLQVTPMFQSIYTNCVEFDIMYCALIRMLKQTPLYNWSTAAACAATKQFTATCPICPEECGARDLEQYPENVCRACLAV